MNSLQICHDYFAFSNARNLEAIESLFHDEATYSSDNTGLYYGKADIMAMVREFFANYPYLHWSMDRVTETTSHIVEVAFTRQARDSQGHESSGQGIERVIVVDGRIRHVEVRADWR